MKYLIVSGGEVKEGFVTWIVKNGGFDVILAADAGMEALYRDHILPDIIVGDFDSVNPDTLEYFHDKEQIEVCMLNPEKDDTDMPQSRETVSDDALSVCSGQSFQVLPRKKQTAFPRVLRQAKM